MTLFATTIFIIGIIGMTIIVFKKIPVLVELSLVSKKIREPSHLRKLRSRISFSPELLLQRVLSGVRALTFRTEKKLIKKALEKKTKFSEDFWDKVKRGK